MIAHVKYIPIRKSPGTGKLDYRGHEIRKFVFPFCHHAESRTCLRPRGKSICSKKNFVFWQLLGAEILLGTKIRPVKCLLGIFYRINCTN